MPASSHSQTETTCCPHRRRCVILDRARFRLLNYLKCWGDKGRTQAAVRPGCSGVLEVAGDRKSLLAIIAGAVVGDQESRNGSVGLLSRERRRPGCSRHLSSVSLSNARNTIGYLIIFNLYYFIYPIASGARDVSVYGIGIFLNEAAQNLLREQRCPIAIKDCSASQTAQKEQFTSHRGTSPRRRYAASGQ